MAHFDHLIWPTPQNESAYAVPASRDGEADGQETQGGAVRTDQAGVHPRGGHDPLWVYDLVILGKPKDQQVWLKAGDKIACSLERLGELKFDLV